MDDRLADRIGAPRGILPASLDAQAPDAETILGGISDGIVALDNEWRLVYANAAATRIWGRDLTMFMGKSLHDSLGIPEDNKFRLAYMASKHNGEPIAFAGYSEIFAAWVDVRGYPHADGYIILFRTAAPEASASWRAENEREREAARSINQRIFDTSLDLILVVDRQGHFLRVSPSARAILGHKPEEMIGRNARDFVYATDLENTRENMRHARRGRDPRNFECRYVHKDGHLVPLTWTGVWSEPDGQYFFIGRDMSERVLLESQLRQAQKMEAVGQLTGGVAHDFNNILTVIIGMTEILGQELAGNADLAPIVAAVDEAASRGAQLTQRMLAFARKQPLQARNFDMNEIVTRAATMLQRMLGEDIAMKSVLADGLWEALADPSQVEDAILNLAVNARDAMPSGGELVIETSNAMLDENYAAQNVEVMPGEYVAVSISDSGNGMAPEVLERVFEPFFTTKEVGRGTGLGLSMVYGFAKQSRGHVKIYSEIGHGTRVIVYLPRAAAAEREADTAQPARAQPEGSEMILVVEDNHAVRRVAVKMLQGFGYQVREAADGPSALAILKQAGEIDLLFTDLIMPKGMSGQELLTHARALRPGLKALFTSGYSEQFIKDKGATEEGVALLSKPYRSQNLAEAVRAALDT
ncbi:MAG TPA: PAS domain S-box protein [Xanthobacteraceae bacterium]|nr:PAS domain S-box protein [Xanthobacteraceae bacterium]